MRWQTLKGLELCRGFFEEEAKPILDKYYPNLKYSVGLIGYGSDVLGYDDQVSTDHMWGPRFYLFLNKEDIDKKDSIFALFSENLPYEYKGYSVNFTEPDENDNGVQHAKFITSGKVNPLIFIQSVDKFLMDEIGTSDLDSIQSLDWLTFSEHRLLSLVAGTLFVDDLDVKKKIAQIEYYPEVIRNYLLASNWDMIATEQAFVKRCGECGDEIGSILVCARIVERLMRLCFLYKKVYAPYSKWFGTAFRYLDVDNHIKTLLDAALHASTLDEREKYLVEAQASVADLHNKSGITEPISYKIESYYGRNIKVIFADKFADAIAKKLKGTELEDLPLIGTLSQIGGLSNFSDDKRYYEQIMRLYQGAD